jgi:hypothetical protein
MVMLKKFKTSLPINVEIVRTVKTVMATTLAVCALALLSQLLVAVINIGMLPIGLTIANSAIPVLNK